MVALGWHNKSSAFSNASHPLSWTDGTIKTEPFPYSENLEEVEFVRKNKIDAINISEAAYSLVV